MSGTVVLRRVAYIAAACSVPVAVWLCVLRLWWWAAVLVAEELAAARWARGWPWTARRLFRRELDRTRHVGGRTHFAYPLAAPVQRRRPVPREPRMRDAR